MPNAAGSSSEQLVEQGLDSEIIVVLQNLELADMNSIPSFSQSTWSGNVEVVSKPLPHQLSTTETVEIFEDGKTMEILSAPEEWDLPRGAAESPLADPEMRPNEGTGIRVRHGVHVELPTVVLRHSSLFRDTSTSHRLWAFSSVFSAGDRAPPWSLWRESAASSDLTE